MPTWNEILNEIIETKDDDSKMFDYDSVRTKYLKAFSKLRDRNLIVYYSDWLTQGKITNIDINDGDMVGFMNAVKDLDKTKGLDLIIHTPGGNPTATESIVDYLHEIFGDDIEVFVPHLAMSAGTMLACSAKVIWMGKQSSLGPIDPQFNGIPAYNIKKEYEYAKVELQKNQDSFRYWQLVLSKYPPAFYFTVKDAISMSSSFVLKWLTKYMFKDEPKSTIRAKAVAKKLNANSLSHSKHFNIIECCEMGLHVKDVGDYSDLQDAVLSIYHCLQICGNQTLVSKIIENHLGKRYISLNNRGE